MSQALLNRMSELEERLQSLEEFLTHFQPPQNGSEKSAILEMRIQSLENKYMAMNARMGKRE